MTSTLLLPRSDGTSIAYTPGPPATFHSTSRPFQSRVAYAAAHVVSDPQSQAGMKTQLDWEATLAYRRYLWSLGLSVAEAMDTAQRGMGLDWELTQELIRRSLAEAHATGNARIAYGADNDQLDTSASVTLDDVEAAYEERCSFMRVREGILF